VQRIDRSGAGRDATKDDPFWLRCRGRRMYEDRRICGARFGYSLASRQEVKDGGESASSFKTYRGRPPQLAASFMSLLGAQSRHARRRCRCPLSGAALIDRGHQAAADCGFFPTPRVRNVLGYRREFLPARGLIVRNVHIGKPRARRGVFWPPVAFVSGLFAADMQPQQRRLVRNISNTRPIRTNDHACSPPFRLPGHIHSVPRSAALGNSCLRAPTRYMPLAAVQGAGLSQRVFSPERAHRTAPVLRCYEN